MSAATDPAVDALVQVALDGGSARGTRVVAVDGPSGSGKTTFAAHLAARLGGAQIVHMDDLYPGWDGLAASVPTLVEQVLRPLADGRPAAFAPYDWERGRYADERIPVPAAAWLVVEGVGCGSRACAPYLSALAWVSAEPGVRRRRGLTRDGAAYAPHWERWARQERALFAAEGTAARADVVLDTTPPGEAIEDEATPG